MKSTVKFVFTLGLFLTLSFVSANAQNNGDVYPQDGQLIGLCYSEYSTNYIYYNKENLKVKPNQTLEFDLSAASFWSEYSDFTWYVNLPGNGGTPVMKGNNIRVQLPNSTGWSVISISAVNKDGSIRASASFYVELTNDL